MIEIISICALIGINALQLALLICFVANHRKVIADEQATADRIVSNNSLVLKTHDLVKELEKRLIQASRIFTISANQQFQDHLVKSISIHIRAKLL